MEQSVCMDDIQSLRIELSEISRSMRGATNASTSMKSLGSRTSRDHREVFGRSSGCGNDGRADEEEALHWAALERLPTYDRLRASVIRDYNGEAHDGNVVYRQVDVAQMGDLERHMFIEKLIKDTEKDNEKFLKKLRNRIDKVGIELPTVEVRYENLRVNAECHVGTRALPTLWNAAKNIVEGLLDRVHLSPSRRTSLTILKDISGTVKPSRITLLLGPPGCGKTTLLMALAGKLNPSLKMKGCITYNGYQLHEFVPQRTSAYISQHDLHIAEMTVRETLDFSSRCQGLGTRQELLLEITRREKQAGIFPEIDIDAFMKAIAVGGLKGSLSTDYILKILGLDICADTMVGNAMRRGVSGGQRKRVTTGEMIVGPTKTLFMDEISTGLDSSTTYQIVKSLQQFAHVMKGTILMSLLQPAPETFDLFDDIILMSEGQIVYHGPRDYVLDFFESCGYKCPERKGTADFLQEVTSEKDQEQYWFHNGKPYEYISPEQFAKKFQQFHAGQKLADELSKPYDKSKGHKAALAMSRYSLSKMELFKACFAREWLLMKRNSFVYLFKSVQLVIVAFIAMTVFIRTRMKVDLAYGNYYLGALFFSLMIMMFNGFVELAMTLTRLPVFFKQRDLLFYPAWAYALPSIVLKVPHSLLESLIWTSLSYYVIGYSPEASRFFRQFLLFFVIHQMAASLFRLIGGISRTMVMANTVCSMAILIIVVLGGFIIPRTTIPKWWIWGYWISPLSYGETAITVNEFLAPRWEKLYSNDTSIGERILENRGLFHKDYFYWIGLGALVGFTVLFNFCFTIALVYLNPIGKSQSFIPKEKVAQIEDNHEVELQRKQISNECSPRESLSQRINSNVQKRGMILPFRPLAISFENMNYYVDMPVEMKEQGVTETRLQLLRDVTGSFRPGVLTALMGISGAGKTTLMDLLAGRKTGGYIEGDIRISGFPKVQDTFARISGYCEQNDIHSPQVTVRESLIYSAWLRLAPEVDYKTKMLFLEEVMDLVELNELRDALVGLPGVSGLSTEQRKRLTIGVELVANPSIIFMDEPSSGLDARAAAIVMRAVRNTADTGRTVVCTIHQPSIDIFEAFDELLLMKRGGEIIFAGQLGHNSTTLVEYFEAIKGVPKIRENCNPSTWMLEVTSIAAEQRLGINFAEIYRGSNVYQRNKALVEELCCPAPYAKDLHFTTQFAQTWWGQFTACLWKQHLTYSRSPHYNLARLSFTLFAALVFGTIFLQRAKKLHDQQDLLTTMGAMYVATLFLGVNNCSTVQPIVDVERTVFYREKGAGMYSALPYALAQVVIEVPYILLQTIIYGLITYSMMGYHWSADKFFWYIFVMFCTFLYFTYYGMLAVAISSNYQLSTVIASAFYSIFNLFSGFIVPRPQLPKWWVWYYWICPTAWTLNGLVTSQYGDITKTIITLNGQQQATNDFLKDYFGFHHDFLGVVAMVLVLFPCFFALLFAYSIRTLNFQKR